MEDDSGAGDAPVEETGGGDAPEASDEQDAPQESYGGGEEEDQTAASSEPAIGGLLSSIQGFKKGKLKKAVTKDRSGLILPADKGSSGSGAGGLFGPGGPSLPKRGGGGSQAPTGGPKRGPPRIPVPSAAPAPSSSSNSDWDTDDKPAPVANSRPVPNVGAPKRGPPAPRFSAATADDTANGTDETTEAPAPSPAPSSSSRVSAAKPPADDWSTDDDHPAGTASPSGVVPTSKNPYAVAANPAKKAAAAAAPAVTPSPASNPPTAVRRFQAPRKG